MSDLQTPDGSIPGPPPPPPAPPPPAGPTPQGASFHMRRVMMGSWLNVMQEPYLHVAGDAVVVTGATLRPEAAHRRSVAVRVFLAVAALASVGIFSGMAYLVAAKPQDATLDTVIILGSMGALIASAVGVAFYGLYLQETSVGPFSAQFAVGDVRASSSGSQLLLTTASTKYRFLAENAAQAAQAEAAIAASQAAHRGAATPL